MISQEMLEQFKNVMKYLIQFLVNFSQHFLIF